MSVPDNKIKETKKLQIQKYNIDKNNEEEFLNKINYLLRNFNFNEDNDNDKYKKEIDNLKNLFKSNLSNTGFINSILYSIKRYIHSSSLDLYQKQNILCLITNIVEISPSQFYNNTDAILSLYQYFFIDAYSQLFPLISENFGGLIKIELSLLNNFQPQKINYNSVLLVYDKYKSFCINNINSNSTPCQICGTLCLTTFIENCSFIYNTNEKLKKLFDILMKQLDNPKEVGILEVLNCLTSLIFCCEMQYMPFAKLTVRKILNICSNPEWIVRKFALNIICTLMYYFQDEIYPLKDIIIPKLKFLKNEKSSEIKELYEQINNNFIEAEKNSKENKVSENNYLNIDEISSERNIENINTEKNNYNLEKKTDKINKNFDFIFINSDNHLITEPTNLNILKKKIDKNMIINNIKNFMYSPVKQKKNNSSRIQNSSDFKSENKISRSKSFGQKNNFKIKEIKGKIKDLKVKNKIKRILSYYKTYKAFLHNNNNLGAKSNSKKKNKNDSKKTNNMKIAVNNRFFFIKNYSLMLKSSIAKKKEENKYNKSFFMKANNLFGNDKKQKSRYSKYTEINNITDNIINEYSTIINSDNNTFKIITPQQSFYSKLDRKKIPVLLSQMMKDCKKKSSKDNCLKKLKVNEYFPQRCPNRINMSRNEAIFQKQKSFDNSNNNNKMIKYTDKNNIYRNIQTLRDSSKKLKKEKISNFNFIKKHFIYKNKVLHHNTKAGASNENKSIKNESINPSRKSSYVLKRNKKIIKKLMPTSSFSSTFKNRSSQKIAFPKNIKNKIKFKFNNSPQNNSNKFKMHETDKDKIKDKYKEKEEKILKIKSIRSKKIYGFKSQKKFNYISKNNSISINNRNLNNDTTINSGYTDINKEKNSFNKVIENKKKVNLSKGNKILSKTKINNNIINKKSKYNLENEFIKYKLNTRKIILELKNKVDELQKTIYDYESESKNREKIKDFVKNKEFINAFNLAIKSNKVNNIYYVLKKYNLYTNENIEHKCQLTSEILSEIINILSKNIYLCDNLSYVITFIKYNIFEKKIIIDYHTSKLLESVLIELFSKRKVLHISESDSNNIKCLLDYIR